jgi:hypothetical protein
MFLGRVDDDIAADRSGNEDPQTLDLHDLIALQRPGNEMRPYLAAGDTQPHRQARLGQLQRVTNDGDGFGRDGDQENETG